MSEHPIVALVRGKLSDPSRPFTMIAELEARPGYGNRLAAVIAESQIVRLSRLEPGCAAYDLCREADAPDRFVALERWRDLAALRDHLATPHFTALGAGLGSLLATEPTIRVLMSVEGRS